MERQVSGENAKAGERRSAGKEPSIAGFEDDDRNLDRSLVEAVVKILPHSPNFVLPWQMKRRKICIVAFDKINGLFIVTNAHSVDCA